MSAGGETATVDLGGERAGALLNKIRQGMHEEVFESLLSRVTMKCFRECVNPVGYKLTTKQKDCMDICLEQFNGVQALIVKALQEEKNKESQ